MVNTPLNLMCHGTSWKIPQFRKSKKHQSSNINHQKESLKNPSHPFSNEFHPFFVSNDRRQKSQPVSRLIPQIHWIFLSLFKWKKWARKEGGVYPIFKQTLNPHMVGDRKPISYVICKCNPMKNGK